MIAECYSGKGGANMDRYNICVKKTFESKGAERTQWPQVGTLTRFPAQGDMDESFILELNMFPSERFYIFPVKEKEPEPEKTPTPIKRGR